MRRFEWLDHVAQALCVDRATIGIIAKRAREMGIVSGGPRGKNAKPFTSAERLNIIELIAMADCLGSIEASIRSEARATCIVDRPDGGLRVIRGSGRGVVVRTYITKETLDVALGDG